MHRGFPQTKLATDLAPLDVQTESLPQGAAVRTDFPAVKRVVLEGQALLKIIKHSNAVPSRRLPVFGQVLGLQVGNTVEITSVLPNIRTNTFGTNISDAERDAMDKDTEVKLRDFYIQAGFDGNCVGRYARTSHGEWPRNLGVFDWCVSEGITPLVLTYDADRTAMGRLCVRAFTAGPAYLQYSRQKAANGKGAFLSLAEGGNAADANTDEGLTSPLAPTGDDAEKDATQLAAWDHQATGLIQEVPVEIYNSTLQQLLIAQLAAKPRRVSNVIMAEASGPYINRQLEKLGECMDAVRTNFEEPARWTPEVVRQMESTIMAQQLRKRADHVKVVSGAVALNLQFARQLSAAAAAGPSQ